MQEKAPLPSWWVTKKLDLYMWTQGQCIVPWLFTLRKGVDPKAEEIEKSCPEVDVTIRYQGRPSAGAFKR